MFFSVHSVYRSKPFRARSGQTDGHTERDKRDRTHYHAFVSGNNQISRPRSNDNRPNNYLFICFYLSVKRELNHVDKSNQQHNNVAKHLKHERLPEV